MSRAVLAAAALALAAGLAQAEGWQAELGLGREQVESAGGDRPDWKQADLALRRTLAPRELVELSWRETERSVPASPTAFDTLRDRELGVGWSRPLGERWSAGLTATASPTHKLLPRASLGLDLRRALGGGWVIGGALKHTKYDEPSAATASLVAERYFGGRDVGEWRAATVVSQAWIGDETAAALRAELYRYFDGGGRVGLVVAGGKELEDPGGGLGVAPYRSDAWALVGRWPLAAGWALTAEAGRTRLRSLYTRSGARLGVQRDF